jgi:hypothetical protein
VIPAFIRRSVAVSFLVALVLATLAGPAFAGGRQVLADYEDNGQINGCYSLAEYEEALRIIRPDQQQYGAAVDVIRQAELTNIRRPGEACGGTSAAGASGNVPGGSGADGMGADGTGATAGAGDAAGMADDGGMSAVVIAMIVAAGLGLAGFAAYLVMSRRRGGGGDPPTGTSLPHA